MKKRSSLIVFALVMAMVIVAGGCKKKPEPIVITPDIEKNHLQRNHIFGTVKSIETTTFYLAEDSLTLSDTNKLASLLKKRIPDITGKQTYSSDGFLLSFYKYGPDKKAILHRIYRYDKEAKLNNWNEYDSTNATAITGLCIYDRNHFLIGEQIYHGDSMAMAFSYTNDGIGNHINSTQSFGDCITHTEYKYNEFGLVYKIIEHEPNGKVFKTAKIEYDNYGDEVNRCIYKSGNQMIEYTYNEYDQDGRQLKTIYEDKIHHVKEFSYYSNYDSQLNWQTEIKIVDNQIISVRNRKIIYY